MWYEPWQLGTRRLGAEWQGLPSLPTLVLPETMKRKEVLYWDWMRVSGAHGLGTDFQIPALAVWAPTLVPCWCDGVMPFVRGPWIVSKKNSFKTILSFLKIGGLGYQHLGTAQSREPLSGVCVHFCLFTCMYLGHFPYNMGTIKSFLSASWTRYWTTKSQNQNGAIVAENILLRKSEGWWPQSQLRVPELLI